MHNPHNKNNPSVRYRGDGLVVFGLTINRLLLNGTITSRTAIKSQIPTFKNFERGCTMPLRKEIESVKTLTEISSIQLCKDMN